MIVIRHLSISVNNPEQTAKAVAEMTNGKSQPFPSKNMSGAWVCMWDENTNHLIEFLPNNYLMYATDYGADFKKMESKQNFNSTHIQLEVTTPLNNIQNIADKYGLAHKFRPNRGGPLYDVWLEDQFLVEFVSDEIRNLKNNSIFQK